jgi:hypothetical protein
MAFERLSEAAQWRDLFQALDHVELWLSRWRKDGSLRPEQYEAMTRSVAERRQGWQKRQADLHPAPAEAELPPGHVGESPASSTLRYWVYLERILPRLAGARPLTLVQVHSLHAEIRERRAALASQLPPDDVAVVRPTPPAEEPILYGQVVPDRPTRAMARKVQRPSVLEIVLDPRNAQWLLIFGGLLMTVGLVILLWVNNLVHAPLVAALLGTINLAVLAVGWYLLRKTSHVTAGNGLTLLACLILPLNLWHWHANDLVTVDRHLWLAALGIAALYAVSAYLVRHENFVVVFMGGVTLTGLLFLADLPPSPARFWEIAAPATLLVVLGLAAIHAERLFPEAEGPFSRRRFGLAFFFSGQALLGAGLLLVFVAQVAGDWLYAPVFKRVFVSLHAEPSPIVGELRWLAILLVAAGTYACLYSDLVVRRLGVYVYIAAFLLMWLLVLCLQYFHLGLGIDLAMMVLALTALVLNVLFASKLRDYPAMRAVPYLGVLLPALAMVLAIAVYVNALSPDLRSVWKLEHASWGYVAALALTAISCRVGAHLYRRTQPELATVYHFGAAGALLLGATALLATLGLERWQEHAPLLILVPIAYLVAARLYRGTAAERPVVWVANVGAGVMLLSSVASAFAGFTQFVSQQPLNLMLALFFLEVCIFYALAAGLFRQPAAVHCATAAACAALWQALTYLGVPGEYYAVVFAVAGLALLACYRLALLEEYAGGRFAAEAFQAANTLLILAFVFTFGLAPDRLSHHAPAGHYIGLCVAMTLVGIGCFLLVLEPGWRLAYGIVTLAQAALTFLVLTILSELTPWQKLEVFFVCVGLLLLVAGHVGWSREKERESELVSLALVFGSLLVGLPLAVAAEIDRVSNQWRWLNELGFLAAGVLLLASGIVCQLKSTTVTGATLTVLYFLSLLIFIPWGRLNDVALFILGGGGVVFATGLLLSVFRERLAALPERYRNREGMFHVLKWR